MSIVNNVNTSVGNTSVGEDEYTLYEKSTITEVLRGLAFEISANSFFQTNTHQVLKIPGLDFLQSMAFFHKKAIACLVFIIPFLHWQRQHL